MKTQTARITGDLMSSAKTAQAQAQIADTSSQAQSLRHLQSMTDSSPQVSQLKALQALTRHAADTSNSRSASVIQRFRGAAGTAEAAAEVPMTLNHLFVANHVAEDEGEAITKTNARILGNGPQAMKNGVLANSLAPLADWTTAINNSTVVLPPQEDWGGELGFDNANDYGDKLTEVAVTGWEAKGTANAVTATDKAISKFVGGRWTVAGGTTTDDSNDNASAAATHVTVDIDHCTQ